MPRINFTGSKLPHGPREWRVYHVHNVEAGPPIQGYVLRDYWVGMHSHYASGRTILCYGKDCPAETHQLPQRWAAYVPFQGYVSGKLVVLPVTWQAVQVLNLTLMRHGNLTSFLWEFKRAGKTNNTRLLASCGKKPVNAPPAHAPFPVMPSVLNMAGLDPDRAWVEGMQLEQDAADQFEREGDNLGNAE